MISSTQRQINQLQSEIAKLDRDAADQAKKESELITKINRATEAMSRAKSLTTMQSRAREIERHQKSLEAVKKKQAEISRKRSSAHKKLGECQARLAREEEAERKKRADSERKLMREREAHQRRVAANLSRSQHEAQLSSVQPLISPAEPLSSFMASQGPAEQNDGANTASSIKYDFFISHASEDKEPFVDSLVAGLQSAGASVWYADVNLKPGYSLRREIDRGLRLSKLGIVVLSPHFFSKEWPQKELDGLVALENAGQSRIIPVWHKVSVDEVRNYSPVLADKVALSTAIYSTEKIVAELIEIKNELAMPRADSTGGSEAPPAEAP